MIAMPEFQPIRETIAIAAAAILAGVLTLAILRPADPLDSYVLLVFLLFVFVGMTMYLLLRGLYAIRKEGA
jgi:hypothetical protein